MGEQSGYRLQSVGRSPSFSLRYPPTPRLMQEKHKHFETDAGSTRATVFCHLLDRTQNKICD